MTLSDEIKTFFASLSHGAIPLRNLPEEYPAYVVRTADGFGVAIETDNEEVISEYFANSHFYTAKSTLNGKETTLLMFQTSREDLRAEFACVCAQFADPGEDGTNRKALLQDSRSWWKRWRNLLGNTISNKAAYSVICEMLLLERVLSFDPSAEWTAIQAGTHDVETNMMSYEAKSTIRRYGAYITVSGQFQLLHPKPLDLYFYRCEESPVGISINTVRDRLIAGGYDESLLERQLSSLGYEKGSGTRDKRYSILEKRIYHVDDSFPKITEASFKGDQMPRGISQISYTVDLDGVPFETW